MFIVILFYNCENNNNNNNNKIIIIFRSFLWQEGWISQRKAVTRIRHHNVIILWGWWSSSSVPPENACRFTRDAISSCRNDICQATHTRQSAMMLWTLLPSVCQTFFKLVLLPKPKRHTYSVRCLPHLPFGSNRCYATNVKLFIFSRATHSKDTTTDTSTLTYILKPEADVKKKPTSVSEHF